MDAHIGPAMDYLVIVGGRDPFRHKSLVQMEDGSACEDHGIPDLPEPKKVASLLVVGGRELYLAGGGTQSGLVDDFLHLTLDRNMTNWEVLTPMPWPASIAGLFSYKEEKIFAVGGHSETRIAEYDIANESWSELAGVNIPFTPGNNYQALKVNSSIAWLIETDKFAVFDMEARAFRTDIVIPACPIKVGRAVVIAPKPRRNLVVVANPFSTRKICTIDPEGEVLEWKTVYGGLAYATATPKLLVAMHGGRTAHLVSFGNPTTWMYYNETGYFVDAGAAEGIPKLTLISASSRALPAVHLPGCHRQRAKP